MSQRPPGVPVHFLEEGGKAQSRVLSVTCGQRGRVGSRTLVVSDTNTQEFPLHCAHFARMSRMNESLPSALKTRRAHWGGEGVKIRGKRGKISTEQKREGRPGLMSPLSISKDSTAASHLGCFFLSFPALASNVDIALFFHRTAEQQDGWTHCPAGESLAPVLTQCWPVDLDRPWRPYCKITSQIAGLGPFLGFFPAQKALGLNSNCS